MNEDEDGSESDQDGLPLLDTKPKEEYQNQSIVGVQRNEAPGSGSEQDVYSFPGDSESESPPPGPWAHCTFVQRRRKKRALLRPFSGLNPWQRAPGAGRRTRVTPTRGKEYTNMGNDVEGMFELNEDEEDQVLDKGAEIQQEIFTCVECSVYFNKQAHLREHMHEHGHVDDATGHHEDEGTARRRSRSFECTECGQNFPDRLVLLKHHELHEESRQKILEDMGRLNNFEKVPEMERNDYRNSKHPTAKESSVNCGQFVGLKCNYRSDVAQDLSDHSKPQASPTRIGGHRASPRIQPKSYKRGTPENVTSSTVVGERYPTRASVQILDSKPEVDQSGPKVSEAQCDRKADPLLGSSQSHTAPASPVQSTEQPDRTASQPEQQQDSVSIEFGLPEPRSPEPSDLATKTPAQRRLVAYKSTGTRRSKRFARGATGQTRAIGEIDSQQTDDVQDAKENQEHSLHEAMSEADSESEGVVAVTVDTGTFFFK